MKYLVPIAFYCFYSAAIIAYPFAKPMGQLHRDLNASNMFPARQLFADAHRRHRYYFTPHYRVARRAHSKIEVSKNLAKVERYRELESIIAGILLEQRPVQQTDAYDNLIIENPHVSWVPIDYLQYVKDHKIVLSELEREMHALGKQVGAEIKIPLFGDLDDMEQNAVVELRSRYRGHVRLIPLKIERLSAHAFAKASFKEDICQYGFRCFPMCRCLGFDDGSLNKDYEEIFSIAALHSKGSGQNAELCLTLPVSQVDVMISDNIERRFLLPAEIRGTFMGVVDRDKDPEEIELTLPQICVVIQPGLVGIAPCDGNE
jgi:hypothetical protein